LLGGHAQIPVSHIFSTANASELLKIEPMFKADLTSLSNSCMASKVTNYSIYFRIRLFTKREIRLAMHNLV
jgi:hypothetical protein